MKVFAGIDVIQALIEVLTSYRKQIKKIIPDNIVYRVMLPFGFMFGREKRLWFIRLKKARNDTVVLLDIRKLGSTSLPRAALSSNMLK